MLAREEHPSRSTASAMLAHPALASSLIESDSSRQKEAGVLGVVGNYA